MLTEIPLKIPKYCCDFCDTKTNNKKDYERHLSTAKHNNNTIVNNSLTNVNTILAQISPNNISYDFICKNCNKEYKSRVGLWKHKKICDTTDNNLNNIDITDSNIIVQLIKQNDEFKHLLVEQSKSMIEQNKTIIELSKNISNTNISHSNINSHNKTFNLQFFLNETCKDAMNIMDFVDSIKIQLCDLENVGKLGFVEGISKIIVQNLNSLDETKRPVHCTDTKREVMYVKDEDKWEKENENKQKMRKVIKHVTHKNSKLLKEFKTKYPGCEKSESRFSDKYDKLIIEAMGGKGDNDIEKEDKIIRNIAKTVTIEKYNP
jgi:endonuclease YncB( thermonuclease family)